MNVGRADIWRRTGVRFRDIVFEIPTYFPSLIFGGEDYLGVSMKTRCDHNSRYE